MHDSPTEVEYFAPLMGALHAPLGVIGRGTLALRPEGLHVVGQRKAGFTTGALGCLGMLVGMFVGGLFAFALGKVDVLRAFSAYGPWGGLVLGLMGGVWLGRRVGRPKPFDVVFPWDAVAVDALRGCEVDLVVKRPARGSLHFRLPPGSDAVAQAFASEVRARRGG